MRRKFGKGGLILFIEWGRFFLVFFLLAWLMVLRYLGKGGRLIWTCRFLVPSGFVHEAGQVGSVCLVGWD